MSLHPRDMAEELARSGGLLIHYSTDYVFDGSKAAPYKEDDATGPLNVYGDTKLEGEQAIVASGCAHVILRTTWVYDIRGKNFLRTVLRLAREKEELRMVGDQYGAPTWARDLAEATTAIIVRRCRCERNKRKRRSGRSGHFSPYRPAGAPRGRGLPRPFLRTTTICCSWPAETGEFGGAAEGEAVVQLQLRSIQTPAQAAAEFGAVECQASRRPSAFSHAGLAQPTAACHAGCHSLIISGNWIAL